MKYQLIFKNGIVYGIRDCNGFLLFFAKVTKYDGQEHRYKSELTEQRVLAEFLLKALIKQ